jgi:hypothetical protein
MSHKIVFLALSAMLLAPCFSVSAQQPGKIPRIGYAASGGDINNPGFIVEAFRRGLRDLGYIEGKNIVVEYRYPGADPRDLGPSPNSYNSRSMSWSVRVQQPSARPSRQPKRFPLS